MCRAAMGPERVVESSMTCKLDHSSGVEIECFVQHCGNYRTSTEATNLDQREFQACRKPLWDLYHPPSASSELLPKAS
jgi:hypothetical protein